MTIGKIGIDRIVFKSIDIDNIDIELLERDFIIMQGNSKHSFRIMKDKSNKSIYINYIKINDKSFNGLNELTIGAKQIQGRIIPYEFLDATLPGILDKEGLNINNINDVESLKKSLELLENRLKSIGFGKINLKSAKIEEIELNINIGLDNKFNEYERILNYIKSLLPKGFKKEMEYRNRVSGEYTGFKCYNTKQSFKIYNKSLQLHEEHKEDIGQELLRIEYKFLDSRKITELFGHNEVDNLIKDFGQVEKVFTSLLKKDLVSKIKKDIEKQVGDCIKKIKGYKIANGKSAIDEYIKNEECLDIEIVLGALKEIENPKIYSRECNKAIQSAQCVNRINLFGNINKLNELLSKLGFEVIQINTTKNISNLIKKYY